MYEYCRVERNDRILTVTIDRPERRNALHRGASFELHQVFDEFETDPHLRVAILTGAGDVAFCAGADLKSEDRVAAEDAVPSSGFGGIVSRFERSKPVIAAVNGFALGGGLEIALACDVIVAAESASFGLPEPRRGLVAGSGGIQRLIRELGPKRAYGMLITGRRVTAAEAVQMGFVNEVVSHSDLLAAANRWATEILECSPTSIRAVLAVANNFDGTAVEQSMEEMWRMPAFLAVLTSPDMQEGRNAFAERRAPQWSDPLPLPQTRD